MRFIRLLGFLICITAKLWSVPIITSISPNFGPDAGGNMVGIIGSGFTSASAVNFGTEPATTFSVSSDTLIIAIPPASRPGVVNVSVTAAGVSAATPLSSYTYQGTWEAVISNAGSLNLTIIDIPSNVASAPIGVGIVPLFSAITPDGKTAYVPGSTTSNVIAFDLVTNTIAATIPVGSAPSNVAISPDGTRAYVSNQSSASVSVINTATNTVITSIPVGAIPGALTITPDGSTLYVSHSTLNIVTPVDLASNTAGTPIPVAGSPGTSSITPDGATLYVVQSTIGAVAVINTATNTVVASIPVGPNPTGVAVTPNGQKVYVVVDGNNTVVALNAATNTLTTVIPIVGTSPFMIAITPDSLTAYVSSDTSSVTIPINLQTNTMGTLIPTGGSLSIGVAITPDEAPYAFFNFIAPNTFDASSSVSPTGTIMNYFWDFGDGTTLSTASPIITHDFQSPGVFPVTLTVTNSAGTSTSVIFTGQTVSNNGGPSATYTLNIPVSPGGENFQGRVVKNKFVTQTDIIHQLTWLPVNNPSILGYLLYRNGELIDIVPGTGPFLFNDHNRRKNEVDTYALIAFTIDGQAGAPSVTTVP